MKEALSWWIIMIAGKAHGYQPGLPGSALTHAPVDASAAHTMSRRDVFNTLLTATVGSSVLELAPRSASATEMGYQVERKLGGGPAVKEGDYVFCDYTAWLDGFDGAVVIDSSTANGGQAVRMGIGPAEAASPFSGLGGSAVAPVRVFVPPGIYEAIAAGAAPPGTLQADTPKYPDAATVGTKFKLTLPPAKAFGSKGGTTGLGVTVPPDSVVYYSVRIRGKTNKASTGF